LDVQAFFFSFAHFEEGLLPRRIRVESFELFPPLSTEILESKSSEKRNLTKNGKAPTIEDQQTSTDGQ
jgi:hypothetical protein